MLELEVNGTEELQITTYEGFKSTLDGELQKAAEGFVKVGYLLKQARDTDILKESGYSNVNEFAMAEYGIDKSVVSRYIRINDRFSEGGNSPLLQEQYREFGYAKLAIMIQLPEEIADEITPEFSKADIQTIHEEVKEEQKISDIEVLLEEKDKKVETEESILGKVMIQLWHDEPELYMDMSKIWETVPTDEEAVNALAPSGAAIYTVRIPGSGRIMMSVKESSDEVVLTNVRSGEKNIYTKKDVIPYLPAGTEKSVIAYWEEKYEEPWPLKEEQPKAAEPKKEVKKPKVTKAKVKKEEVAPVQPDNEQESEKDAVNVEVVPGAQTEITDMKKVTEAAEQEIKKAEIMAVPYHTEEEEMEVVSGEVESPSAQVNTQREPDSVMEDIPKNTDNEPSAISEEEYEEKKRTYKQLFNQACEDASGNVDMDMYLTARQHMKAAMEYLEKLEQLDNTEIIEYQEEEE